MKGIYTLLIFICFGICSTLKAQSAIFTSEDSIYFVQQVPRYQMWLNNQGFGALLEVYEIDPDPNMVSLILESTMSDSDSTFSAWHKMKANFSSIHSKTLEEHLFETFCKMMQVPDSMAVVEIYNEIGDTVPCFYRGMYVNDMQFLIDSVVCMNKQSIVEIEDFDLKPEIKGKSIGIDNKKLTSKKLKKEIRTIVLEHYEKEKKGNVVFLNNDDALLYFEVTDIRRVVLDDAANPTLAQLLNWFGLDLDWVKREFLTITIKYDIKEDQHLIEIDVQGKYGSGLHTPQRNAYINMEPEFEGYVKKHADFLAEKIKTKLTK